MVVSPRDVKYNGTSHVICHHRAEFSESRRGGFVLPHRHARIAEERPQGDRRSDGPPVLATKCRRYVVAILTADGS